MSRNIKKCFIPACDSTSDSDLHFFLVPSRNKDLRKKWFSAARIPVTGNDTYCCEHHFNLEQDTVNYMWYKMIGQKLILKKGVVPHEQMMTPRKRRPSQFTDSAKRRKRDALERLTETERHCKQKITFSPHQYEEDAAPNALMDDVLAVPLEGVPEVHQHPTVPDGNVQPERNTQVARRCRKQKLVYRNDPDAAPNALMDDVLAVPLEGVPEVHPTVPDENMGGVLAVPLEGVPEVHPTVPDENMQPERNRNDPGMILISTIVPRVSSPASQSSRATSSSTITYHPSSSDADHSSSPPSIAHPIWITNHHLATIRAHSKYFTGIPRSEMMILKLLAANVNAKDRDIFLCLKKLRLNDVNFRLGLDFGLSEHQAGQIFRKTLPLLSKFFSHFVYWPEKSEILKHLPMQFRLRFKNVQSLIDCFEIEIEKPSSASNQALSWSSYKNCNTVKILISCTPNGLINFLSKAYGGRITDNKIVEISGYLDVVPPNSAVLGDRGFKQIEPMLLRKKVTLIRPASVSADKKMTKEEVRSSRRIASVRIHVERVIGRIREFRFLDIHSRIDIHLLNLIDHAVLVVAGIVNLQSPMINK